MSNLAKGFLAGAFLSLIVALIGHNHPIVDGLAKAMFGVFLIGCFIDVFFGKKNA